MGIMEDYKELQMIENVKIVATWINKYKNTLEDIRKILAIPELPPVDDDNLMTATELMIEVASKREEKLNKIKSKIDEVLK